MTSWSLLSIPSHHSDLKSTITDSTKFFLIYVSQATFVVIIPKLKKWLFFFKINFQQSETFFYCLNKKLQAAKIWKGRFLAVFALNWMLKTGFSALTFLFVHTEVMLITALGQLLNINSLTFVIRHQKLSIFIVEF